MMDKERELRWLKSISKLLVGKKIVEVQYMSNKDQEKFGWDFKPIEIGLEDGTWLTPTSDDEGNDAGSLFTSHKDLPIIPVM